MSDVIHERARTCDRLARIAESDESRVGDVVLELNLLGGAIRARQCYHGGLLTDECCFPWESRINALESMTRRAEGREAVRAALRVVRSELAPLSGVGLEEEACC